MTEKLFATARAIHDDIVMMQIRVGARMPTDVFLPLCCKRVLCGEEGANVLNDLCAAQADDVTDVASTAPSLASLLPFPARRQAEKRVFRFKNCR